jgi:polysaccharide biosynthesis/export protein
MTQRRQIWMGIVALAFFGLANEATLAQQPAMESTSLKAKRTVKVTPNAAEAGSKSSTDWRHADDTASVPEEYSVGQADVLHINVWKEPELSQSVVVRPDGKISLPLVSELKVAGLTASQIQQLLAERLKAFLVAPQVTVTVAEIHSKTVFITGEVAHAGEYPLLTPVTVLQLIARAGGFSTYANRKGIFVIREADGHTVRSPFNYNDVIQGKNAEENIELRPGDTVVVP